MKNNKPKFIIEEEAVDLNRNDMRKISFDEFVLNKEEHKWLKEAMLYLKKEEPDTFHKLYTDSGSDEFFKKAYNFLFNVS